MLCREIVAVCSEIHTKHINTLCGQNVEFVNVKLVVHIVSNHSSVRSWQATHYLLHVAPRLAARKSVACHVRGQASEAEQRASWLRSCSSRNSPHAVRFAVTVLLTQSHAQTALVVCSDIQQTEQQNKNGCTL
jgi:hypothetical protein